MARIQMNSREIHEGTDSMEDKVPMAVFQSTKHHDEPAFDVSRLENDALFLDNHFQVAVQELEHQVEVLPMSKDVDQLNEGNHDLSTNGTGWPPLAQAKPR